ncbi:30S ribosomal protein S8e [Candidatus Woesearchaeota archaeon]|nr:30S ribosomal protein S8e [Candidatus Woesearchaeota archaeon]
MAISQAKAKKSQTGSRYHPYRKKRLHETGRLPTLTKLEEKKITETREMGGYIKYRLLSHNIANVFDPKSKKHSHSKIITITDNPANRHFVRRNIMTKGAIIQTEKGKARITNRPGQEGQINAVLIQ